MSLKTQLLKFGSVGIVVTMIDFMVLNLLRLTGLPLIPANLISSSIAMTVSYRLNRSHVFKKSNTTTLQKALFISGTLFGLFVIQTIIIHGLQIQKEPLMAAISHLPFVTQNSEFIFTNAAKVVATGVTTVWNFAFYKFVVFRRPKTRRRYDRATAQRMAAVLLNRS